MEERSSRKRNSILKTINNNANPTKHLGRLKKIIYMEIPKTVSWNLLMVFTPLSPTHPTVSAIDEHLILHQPKGKYQHTQIALSAFS